MNSPPPPASPLRRRLGLLVLGVVGVIALLVWQRAAWQLKLGEVRTLLVESRVQAAWDRAVELRGEHPDDAELALLLAKTARRSGRADEARRQLERATQLGAPAEEIEREQTLATLQSGGYPRVKAEVERIIASNLSLAESDEFFEAMAKGHLAAYRIPDLQLCLDFWLKSNPDAPEAHMIRGDLAFRLSLYTDAADAFRRVLQLRPDHERARRRLLETLLQLNEITEAARIAAESTEPDHPELLLRQAQCEHRLGNPDQARQWLQRALDNSPSSIIRAGLLEELGRLALEDARPEEAIESLEVSVALAPENSPAWDILSNAYAMAGDREKARATRERATSIQKAYTRLTDVTHELVEKPESAELRFEAGRILMDNGLPGEGAKWMQTALQQDPDYRPAHEALADYFTSIGRERTAESHRREAKRLQPPSPAENSSP